MLNQLFLRPLNFSTNLVPASARAASVACALLISGCSSPDQQAEIARPVRVFQVGSPSPESSTRFAAEIQPRRQTTLAFRVGGKVAARLVDIGDPVKPGQAIARLDAADYRLALQSLKAQLAAAQTDQAYSHADLARFRELLDQHIITPPEWERHQTGDTATRKKVEALQAQIDQAANQVHYTNLLADQDGVITALSFESGDVVAAGQPIARLARDEEKEVWFDLPEHRLAEIEPGQPITVTLGSLDTLRWAAKIREIAPAADPATRTYRVKASLMEGTDKARLGMTATAWLPARQYSALAIPRSAVFTTPSETQQARVWILEDKTHTVRSVPVSVGPASPGDRIAVTGLQPGQRIVSAGVQRLLEGQAVRIYGSDPAPATEGLTP